LNGEKLPSAVPYLAHLDGVVSNMASSELIDASGAVILNVELNHALELVVVVTEGASKLGHGNPLAKVFKVLPAGVIREVLAYNHVTSATRDRGQATGGARELAVFTFATTLALFHMELVAFVCVPF
jgi:hypothetical protein